MKKLIILLLLIPTMGYSQSNLFSVIGRMLVKGQGSTSATTALQVQNSSSVDKLVVKDDGAIEIGTNASATTQTTSSIAAVGSETNIGLALVQKGMGSITADIPDGGTNGGNARGAYAVDLQLERNANTQVASGANSVLVGGLRNRANGSNSTAVGGREHLASGERSGIFAGILNVTSAIDAVVIGGESNTAAQRNSGILSGVNNYADGTYSAIAGGNGARTTMFGQFARSNGGFSQTSDIRLRRTITGTAQTELTLDGSTPSSTSISILALPTGATAGRLWNATIQVVAICTTQGNGTVTVGESLIGNYAVGIKRIGTSTSLVGTVQTLHTTQADTNMASSVVTIDADDTNESLRIQFTPPTTAGSTTVIRVVATVYLTEVGY